VPVTNLDCTIELDEDRRRHDDFRARVETVVVMVGGRSGRPRRLGKLTPPNCRATAEGVAVRFVVTRGAARAAAEGPGFDRRQWAHRQRPVMCAFFFF